MACSGDDKRHPSRVCSQSPNRNECLHRQLKASLISIIVNPDWANKLPLDMLGLITTIEQDVECCPAELVYETTLRLPGDFFASGKYGPTD